MMFCVQQMTMLTFFRKAQTCAYLTACICSHVVLCLSVFQARKQLVSQIVETDVHQFLLLLLPNEFIFNTHRLVVLHDKLHVCFLAIVKNQQVTIHKKINSTVLNQCHKDNNNNAKLNIIMKMTLSSNNSWYDKYKKNVNFNE